MIWGGRRKKRSRAAWERGVSGTVAAGEELLSPGQVPCVGYGIVLSTDSKNHEVVVTHEGGWTRGFSVRADDGRMIAVPEGTLDVEGTPVDVGVDLRVPIRISPRSGSSTRRVFGFASRSIEQMKFPSKSVSG
jgi:hypothetical protein